MALSKEDIQKAVSGFELDPKQEKEALDLQQRFLDRYPRERLSGLKLDEYALGITNPPGAKDPQSRGFSWWVEFGTEKLGRIGGATALKHIVYFDSDEKKWKYKGFNSEQEAFNAAKNGIVRLLELADADQFDMIDRVAPFENQNLTRGKYLYLYCPHKFLPVFSADHLRTFCELLGFEDAESLGTTAANRKLVEFKQSDPIANGWSNYKFSRFLYQAFNPNERFWKIAPGENANLWPECRDGGYICVGWDEMGDLNQYKDRPTFNAAFEDNFPAKKPTQLWNYRGIREGDRILANRGKGEIVGVGIATGPYYFNKQRSTFKQCVPVQWLRTDAYSIPPVEVGVNWRTTIHEMSRHDFELLTSSEGQLRSRLIWRRSLPEGFDLQASNPKVIEAKAIRAKFDEVLNSRQLASGEPYLNAQCRDAFQAWTNEPTRVLPSICLAVLSNWFLTSLGTDERKRSAGELWDLLFLCRPAERLTDPGRQNINKEPFENWWRQQMALQGGGEANKHLAPVLSDERFKHLCEATFMPEEFFVDCEELLRTKQQLILQGAPGTGKTFVAEHLANWWSGSSDRMSVVQFHESYGYEDFIHGIRPAHDAEAKTTVFTPQDGAFLRFCQEAAEDPDNKYVMVIDEINRAKTARVFGELLYLLEYRDKKAQLQYGQTFAIPANVYLIGTMNTVDRSIALVDYALRRRFAFLTLRPVVGGRSMVLSRWMEANDIDNRDEVERLFVELNRLVAEQDAALMIGHSYFMSETAVDSSHFSEPLLKSIWRYYILPLVAEYEYQLDADSIEEKYGIAAVRRNCANVLAKRANA